MATTVVDDATSVLGGDRPRLRTNVLDALMKAKGVHTVEAQAQAFGLNRTHWFDIRAGKVVPNLGTAMKVAAGAGAAVEVLFGRQP